MFQFTVILSQTFFYLENNTKKYLYEFIKTHKLFHSEEMWRKFIDFIINEKKDKFDELEFKREGTKGDEAKKQKKINEIVFAQLIAITNNMVDFEFDINKTEKIMCEYIDKYKLNETYKQLILDIINSKKIQTKEKQK